MTVYLDLLMALNFLVDFLLLVCAERIAGFIPDWGRIALASVLGGIYSGFCVLPGVYFLGHPLWRTVSLAAMAIVAFGVNKAALRKGSLFVLMTMTLGGAAMGIQAGRFGSILGTALAVTVLCILGFRGKTETSRYVPIELEHGGKKIRMTALHDTGNTLRDPVSGEQVLVAGADIGKKIFGLDQQQLENPVETMLNPPFEGLRLIPYSTVGTPGGMLLAIRCDRVRIDHWQGSVLVAFSPCNIGKEDVYQMLTGGVL